ncbi:peptidyl-prolyl cis-trans isomerase [uncultured Eubacterium sp.]|uniref:peptidylprolyl isomerase n=1 Tax=uncultured Eubacterium sp. TaxID=165185 RepID=UPI0025F97CC0|nr:peptidyl-prolyl cis-trans isomerase [uncultured Eubacterium sp.]
MKSRNMRKKAGALAVVLVCSTFLGACSSPLAAIISKPVFKVGSESCSQEDAKAILMNYQKEYSNLYGIDMWEHDYGQEQSLEEYIKNLTLAQMAQVYTLDVIASEKEVTLSEDEQKKVSEAAKTYRDGLDDTEREYIGLSEKQTEKLFERYVLAEKLYETLKTEVNQEVSDDEARVMKLKQIYTTDQTKAQTYLAQLQGGTDFETLAQTANEADSVDINVNRTTFSDDVSEKLFALTDGGITDVIEIDGGYYIFYCSSAFDAELTDAHKKDVLEKRMSDAVTNTYAEYMNQLSSKENQDVWSSVTVDTSLKLDSASFMEVYQQYFSAEQQ